MYRTIQYTSEEVRQGSNYALHHALACTINCILLAITHAYKYSWLLKPRFSCYLPRTQRGSAAQKVYFLKTNIMELKIGLNFKGISASHWPEVW